MNSGGTIVGGILSATGGTFNWNGGTLSGVTYHGTLAVGGTAQLRIRGGLTATGADGTGPGTINDTGSSSQLFFDGQQTLDNATLNVGAGPSLGTTIWFVDSTGAPNPILTLGSQLNIIQTGKLATISDAGTDGGEIVNNGAITAGFSGGTFTISPLNFINNGSIAVSNGDSFLITPRSSTLTFTNNGAITVGTGGTVRLQPTKFTNLPGTTLTGGSYEVDVGSTLELNQNATIVTDNATIILSGAGSAVQGFNTTTSKEVAIDSTLTTIVAAGTLEILGGRNWTSTQAMTNAGTLKLGGGTFAPASLTSSGTVSGFGTMATTFTNNGTLSVDSGQTMSLVGGSLTNLSGTTLTGGIYTVGAGGTLQLANNTSIGTLSAVIALKSGSVVQSLNTGTAQQVSLEAGLTAIGATGALEILNNRNYTTANTITNAGTLQLGGGTFTSGALTDAAGSTLTGFGTVASAFTDSGAVTSSGGALAFSGTGDQFNAALTGTEIDFSGGTDALNSGSSLTAATVGLSGGAAVTLTASQSFGAALAEGAGTTLALGANTLTLTGAGSTLAGSVTGTGTLAFAGGTQALNSGASLGVANWSISGADVATLNENLTYAGTFSQGAGTTLTVATGDTLTLTGAATLSGTVNGAGTVKLSSATLSGLAIGGTAKLNDVGTVHQTGTVTVGDAGSTGATLLIGTGATWSIDNNSGIARGASGASSIKNSGLFIKSGGTGVSKIGVKISDTGAIEAASGTLDFTQAITGAGTMAVDSGATLEVAKSAASTLHMNFNGGNAILALNKPSQFAATIAGFAATDAIDLIKIVATAATLGANDTLVITNGATTIATLQLAGDYTGAAFNVASDGKGGTDITVTPGPVHAVGAPLPHDQTAGFGLGHRFIAAMAGFGDSHGPVSVFLEGHYTRPGMLAAPRMAMA